MEDVPFFTAAPQPWNTVPEHIKNAETLQHQKNLTLFFSAHLKRIEVRNSPNQNLYKYYYYYYYNSLCHGNTL